MCEKYSMRKYKAMILLLRTHVHLLRPILHVDVYRDLVLVDTQSTHTTILSFAAGYELLFAFECDG